MYWAACKQMLQSIPAEYFRNNNIDGYLDRIFGARFPGYDSD